MILSVLQSAWLIALEVRLIRQHCCGPRSLRWWTIIVLVYAAVLRVLRIAGVAEHSVAGVLSGEPVLIGLQSIMLAHAWRQLE